LKVTSQRIEGCQAELSIEVEPEEMDQALDKAYRRLVKKVMVPGFRKGKAPRPMLERHIGRESLVSEAFDQMVPELYEQALKEQEIDAIGQPDMEIEQLEPPIFKAKVPLRPVVELGDYHSITATPDEVEVTDEKVDEALQSLRQMHASWEPVDRPAGPNDMVTLSVKGTVDGEVVLDNQDTTYRITLGSAMPAPGFAEALVDMKAGDQKEFTSAFVEDHPTKEVAGKDCRFEVSISEIKQENLPELDDEFVKSLNEEGIETVDQLRERMFTNLQTVAEREAKSKLEGEAIEAAVGVSKVEFPAVLVEQEVDRMANEQLMRMGGMNLQTYLGYRGCTEEDFRDELRPVAEKKIATSLVLNKVFEAENIEVSDADIDAEVERMLQNAGERGEQMKEFFKSPQARESVKGELLTRKTIDRLVEIATSPKGGSVEEAQTDDVTAPEVTVAEEKEEASDDAA